MSVARGTAFAYAAVSVLLVSVAQLAMRWGMMQLPPISEALATPSSIAHAPGSYAVLTGLTCYGVSMVCWVAALRSLPLRVAYPLLSVSYVIVYLAAGLIPAFAEHLNATRSLGVLLIVCGITTLLSGDRGTRVSD